MAAPLRSDPLTAASSLALGRALRWYLDEVPNAKSPPVSGEQARALLAAVDGGRRWESALFDDLMTFGRAIFRLASLSPEIPECNVGDTLIALAARPLEPGATPWPVDTGVEREAFDKLEFRAVSEGIVQTQRENREGWWAHGQRNRALIEDAATLPAVKRLAVVLGAGQAFDLPLPALARSYERLVLIDIDQEALEASVAAVFKDPGLRQRVELRVVDLAGINAHLVRQVDALVDAPGSADEVQASLEAFCRTFRTAAPPPILAPGERADLVVS